MQKETQRGGKEISADALSEARDYGAAINAYNVAIELNPKFAEAYNNRAVVYYLNRDAERVIADFTRAIELRPNYPKAYNSAYSSPSS